MPNQLDKDEQTHGRKLFLLEGVMASSESHTFMGNLLTAFALALGSSERQIGILSTTRQLAGFMQLFTNHFLERTGSKRHLSYYVFGISRTFRIIVALLPTISLALVFHNSAIWWLISLMF